jgi:hypothetical protein
MWSGVLSGRDARETPGTRLMPCPRMGWRPSRSRRARARLGAIHPQLDGSAGAPPPSGACRAELPALALAGARLPALISAVTMPGVRRALRSEHRLTPRWGAPFPSHALGRVSALSPLRCCAPTLRTISRWGGKLVCLTKPHRAHASAPCENTLSASRVAQHEPWKCRHRAKLGKPKAGFPDLRTALAKPA